LGLITSRMGEIVRGGKLIGRPANGVPSNPFNSMAPGSVRKPLVTLFQRSRLEECLLFAQPGRSCRSISSSGDRCMPRQRKSKTQAANAKHAAGIDIGATSI
jgi:hypothetical protein